MIGIALRYRSGSGFSQHNLGNALERLRPGQSIDGTSVFWVKDGTKLAALALEPYGAFIESFCRKRFDPPLPEVDAMAVEISLHRQEDKPPVLTRHPAISSTPPRDISSTSPPDILSTTPPAISSTPPPAIFSPPAPAPDIPAPTPDIPAPNIPVGGG